MRRQLSRLCRTVGTTWYEIIKELNLCSMYGQMDDGYVTVSRGVTIRDIIKNDLPRM